MRAHVLHPGKEHQADGKLAQGQRGQKGLLFLPGGPEPPAHQKQVKGAEPEELAVQLQSQAAGIVYGIMR